MKFLPENYQAPKNSNHYMKLQDGINKFRILSQPILGWEDWIENKPVRYPMDQRPTKSHDPKKPIRHFWAFIVWNYQEERIQILQVTQTTIRNNLEALCKDEDWGEPYFYDIKVVRKGEGIDTEYMVNPVSHSATLPEIIEAFNETPINLEALFEGKDPFSKEYSSFTKGIFKREEIKKEEPKKVSITDDEAHALKKIFNECNPKYVKQVMDQLKKSSPEIDCVEKIPRELFARIFNAASKKRQEHMKSQMEGEVFEFDEVQYG